MNQTDIENEYKKNKKCEYLRQYRLQKIQEDPEYYNQKQKKYYEKNANVIKVKTALYRERTDYYNANKERLLALKREKYKIKMDALKEEKLKQKQQKKNELKEMSILKTT